MSNDAFWAELAKASTRDLRCLQLKLTYIGTQRKPISSIAFTTCFHLLRMEWFEPVSVRMP